MGSGLGTDRVGRVKAEGDGRVAGLAYLGCVWGGGRRREGGGKEGERA